MPIARKNYHPPAGSVIDANEPRASWDGHQWRRDGKKFKVPSSHRLVGRPGGSLNGWYYDWKKRAWMEPDRALTPTPGGTPPRMPTQSAPQTTMPAKPTQEKAMQNATQTTPPTLLDYWKNHPLAPVISALCATASIVIDDPLPPTIPENLPEAKQKELVNLYHHNRELVKNRRESLRLLAQMIAGVSESSALFSMLPMLKSG